MGFQLRRLQLQFSRDVLADAVHLSATAGADLLFFRQVMLMADLRQLVPVDLAFLAATAMALHVDGVVGTREFRRIAVGRQVRVQIEQMALPFVFAETFSPSAIRPTLVPCQFVERGGMLLLQLLVRGGRFAQHAVQFRHLLLGFHHATFELSGLLECRQQEALAFAQIVGKKVGAIHVADYCNNLFEQEKPSSSISSTDAAISSQPATTVSQVKTTEDLRQLDIVQLDALLLVGSFRKLKRARLQPFVPNAKTVLIPEQDLDPVPITVEEQEQVARQGILVEHRLGQAHQGVETVAAS